MSSEKFDIGIIGAGPAGYTAALHAREKGLSVVMFEKNVVGGVCLNRGCIPTKAIIHASETGKTFEEALVYKDEVVAKVRKGLELSLKNAGVVVINEEAELSTNKLINLSTKKETYECGKVIVATGSKPRELKELPFDGKYVLSSDDVLNLTKLPKSVVIVGSGAIGTEWARIFAAFGVEVTVLEAADKLLPIADFEVSKRTERIFKSKGIKFFTSSSIEKIDEIKPEMVLVAVGREPSVMLSETKHLKAVTGCENLEILRDAQNDENKPSTIIGDACGEIQLAHYASKQALELIKGIKFDKTLVPSVVYGTPEIAWVGAREQDLEPDTYQKASILISSLGKSHCDDCTDGFIKILARDDKIIGAHIVSKEASALIHQLLIAMQCEIPIAKLKEVCFAHPTYSEGIFECLMKL